MQPERPKDPKIGRGVKITGFGTPESEKAKPGKLKFEHGKITVFGETLASHEAIEVTIKTGDVFNFKDFGLKTTDKGTCIDVLALTPEEAKESKWSFWGASKESGFDAGIVIIEPDRESSHFRFQFDSSVSSDQVLEFLDVARELLESKGVEASWTLHAGSEG